MQALSFHYGGFRALHEVSFGLAEREVTALAATAGQNVSHAVRHYLNRLSDLLFVASRRANDNGAGDVKWVPGLTRPTDGD